MLGHTTFISVRFDGDIWMFAVEQGSFIVIVNKDDWVWLLTDAYKVVDIYKPKFKLVTPDIWMLPPLVGRLVKLKDE